MQKAQPPKGNQASQHDTGKYTKITRPKHPQSPRMADELNDDFDDFDNDPANPANRGEPALSSVPYQAPPAPYADIFSWPTDEEAAEAAILAAEIQASADWRKGIEDTRNPSLSQRMADKFKGDDK